MGHRAQAVILDIGHGLAHRGNALLGNRQIVEPKLKKTLARIIFVARVSQQRFNLAESEGDTNARKCGPPCHKA